MANNQTRGSGARTNPAPLPPPSTFGGSSGGRSNPNPLPPPSPSTGRK